MAARALTLASLQPIGKAKAAPAEYPASPTRSESTSLKVVKNEIALLTSSCSPMLLLYSPWLLPTPRKLNLNEIIDLS